LASFHNEFGERTQFDYLYDAFAQRFPSIRIADGRHSLFQFVTTPIAADWNANDLSSTHHIVNSVPANLDGFYVKGKSFDETAKNTFNSDSISGDLEGDLLRWKSQTTLEFDVRINENQRITAPWETPNDTIIPIQCWKTNVGVNVNTGRILRDPNYELRLSAIGLESYRINRDRQFDDSDVNPDMHLIPTEILVMYKPQISLTMSIDTYREQLGAYADTEFGWIEIFGFRLEVGYDGRFSATQNYDGTITLTFTSPENAAPQIVGVTSRVLYKDY
jgi:hypothetical protein